MRYITTKNDLRNWVDNATSGWDIRHITDVEAITDGIQADDHPAWGSDWSKYLESINLMDFLPEEDEKDANT